MVIPPTLIELSRIDELFDSNYLVQILPRSHDPNFLCSTLGIILTSTFSQPVTSSTMSSSVYFRFKSQKEPSRVVFDGTGISVFELKREIIALNHLGDGTDFELLISSDETNEGRLPLIWWTTTYFGADSNVEFDDDTSIIPRSTTVIAKRLPAQKPGRGGAARYVTGKMPHNPKNSFRADSTVSKANSLGKLPDKVTTLSDLSNPQTEEQKIAAMFKMGAEQWAEQQQEMSQ